MPKSEEPKVTMTLARGGDVTTPEGLARFTELLTGEPFSVEEAREVLAEIAQESAQEKAATTVPDRTLPAPPKPPTGATGPNLPPPPKRETFETDEDNLEAKAGWLHRVGPILGLTAPRSPASPPPPASPDTAR